MARKKTGKTLEDVKATLSERLRAVRQELFGEHGGPELAKRLGLPTRTWYNYETGTTVPGEVVVRVIEDFDVSPAYLDTGTSPMFRGSAAATAATAGPDEALLRETNALLQELLGQRGRGRKRARPRRRLPAGPKHD